MKENSLGLSLLSSLILHGVAILVAPLIVDDRPLRRENIVPVSLVELSQDQANQPVANATKSPAQNSAKLQVSKPPARRSAVELEQPAVPVPIVPSPPPAEAKPVVPAKAEAVPVGSNPRAEDGGGEAGVVNSGVQGNLGLASAMSTKGVPGGTIAAGLAHGVGVAGTPARPGVLRTNRAAKPIQTARATYPPMALRAGLEGDVTLKIEVDAQGMVTKTEIIKSGGAGFDEEALRAVQQSRFEPAQIDGQNIPAEFTYVYRFRLQR